MIENLENRAREIDNQLKQQELVSQTQNNSLLPEEEISLESLHNTFLMNQIKQGKSLQEITTDHTKALITNQILNDKGEQSQKYKNELAKEQKDTIKEEFKKDKATAVTKTITEKQKQAEAFYKSCRPILEFDFDNLIKRKTKKKQLKDGQAIDETVTQEEKRPKTYEDRSYGIPLMVLMLCLLTIPYCIITVILALCNGINAILEGIATFGTIARTIATTIFIIIVGVLVVYVSIIGIEQLFNIEIINKVLTA